jgi:signal transduction histidine kinase
MDDMKKIFQIAGFFLIFVVLGYVLNFYISSFFSFFLIFWILFLVIIFFILFALYEIQDNVDKKFKEIENFISNNKPEQTQSNLPANKDKNIGFISVIAHEIRSPVSIIKGYTYILLNDPEISKGVSQDVKKYVEKIEIQSEHLLGLLENLLSVSLMDEDSLTIDRKEFDLLDVTKKIIDDFYSYASQKKQQIILKSELTNAPIVADKLKIEEVLSNLINNAINYTLHGGKIIVEVRKDQDPKDNNNFIVSVKDNGIGISEENVNKIFEKFFRAENSEIQVKGTGLGLYIADRIINMHKGKMWVESTEKKGSTFYFSLPDNALKHS